MAREANMPDARVQRGRMVPEYDRACFPTEQGLPSVRIDTPAGKFYTGIIWAAGSKRRRSFGSLVTMGSRRSLAMITTDASITSGELVAPQSSPQARVSCSSRGTIATSSLRKNRDKVTRARPSRQTCPIFWSSYAGYGRYLLVPLVKELFKSASGSDQAVLRRGVTNRPITCPDPCSKQLRAKLNDLICSSRSSCWEHSPPTSLIRSENELRLTLSRSCLLRVSTLTVAACLTSRSIVTTTMKLCSAGCNDRCRRIP
jgi:hypothetical protein